MFAMKGILVRCFLLVFSFTMVTHAVVDAQQKKRTSTKRAPTKKATTKKTTNSKTKTTINPSDKSAVDTTVKKPPAEIRLPLDTVKQSLRNDAAIERNLIKDRVPLVYQHLREDDAVYRERLWREIDTREKMNQPFRYSARDDNGDQRFMVILLQAIQDKAVIAFNADVGAGGDDRFTTPLTISQVAERIGGGQVEVTDFDSLGNPTGKHMENKKVNFDSFYRFHIKEEVVFDKQSSRLYWRILGIAPVQDVITTAGVNLGPQELFWVYYPDLRPYFAKHEVYNPKNWGQRMTWEELFESRFFTGRIIKSTLDNPYDLNFAQYPGLKDNPLFQLYEGEKVKDKIFNYEQNLWSY
jgi:gliding motility associated protien GldN